MTGRVVVLFLLYLAGTLLTTLTIFLIPVFQGFVLYCLCRWTIQWKRVREGTGRIVGGDPDFKIDTTKCTVTWPARRAAQRFGRRHRKCRGRAHPERALQGRADHQRLPTISRPL